MSKSDNKSLAQSLYSAEQVKHGEARAAEQSGLTMRALMSAAGQAVFKVLQSHHQRGSRVAVFCGEGNNGGDGYVVARLARNAGYRVTVFALKPARVLDDVDGDDAQHARHAWRQQNAQEHDISDFEPTDFDVAIDAVFGIGLSRPLEGALARWVEQLNKSGLATIAVDIPSGLDADTGGVMGAAVNAAVTVTMVAKKRGLYTADGPAYCGLIELAELGVGEAFAAENKAQWRLADGVDYGAWLGPRRATAHKGHFGHLLLIAGGLGMSGAAILAMRAALRTGAGKVSVACHPASAAIVAASQPEAMVHAVQDSSDLTLLLEQATTVVIGPGLGNSEWAQGLFNKVIEDNQRLMVIDADGLNLLSRSGARSDHFILTPHPGEAARLLQLSVKQVEQDRFKAVEAIQQRYGGQVLLKGAGSLIASDRGNFVINRGSPALASGGMGDCLSGVTGALLAQQLAPGQAIIAASYWHAVAGEYAGKDGERGTLASDLLDPLRRLVNNLPL